MAKDNQNLSRRMSRVVSLKSDRDSSSSLSFAANDLDPSAKRTRVTTYFATAVPVLVLGILCLALPRNDSGGGYSSDQLRKGIVSRLEGNPDKQCK